MVERADKFENGYIGVRGWWFNVSGVLNTMAFWMLIFHSGIVWGVDVWWAR